MRGGNPLPMVRSECVIIEEEMESTSVVFGLPDNADDPIG
jgi:hypothetical protein